MDTGNAQGHSQNQCAGKACSATRIHTQTPHESPPCSFIMAHPHPVSTGGARSRNRSMRSCQTVMLFSHCSAAPHTRPPGAGPAYPSESSARSSARSRSLSMMTSLRATCSRTNTAYIYTMGLARFVGLGIRSRWTSSLSGMQQRGSRGPRGSVLTGWS